MQDRDLFHVLWHRTPEQCAPAERRELIQHIYDEVLCERVVMRFHSTRRGLSVVVQTTKRYM